MKRATLPISIALLASVVSCSSPSGPGLPEMPPQFQNVAAGAEIVLAVGTEASVDGGALLIRFQAVTEDSRCPLSVTCVWEGRGVVSLTVTPADGEERTISLETHLTQDRTAEIGGYRLTLEGLLPWPAREGPIPTEDYRLLLKVEASG